MEGNTSRACANNIAKNSNDLFLHGFSKDISHSFTDIAGKKKIPFSVSSNIDMLEIYFDKDKIEKILFNLLPNAFKYTHADGTVSINFVYNGP
ncbi:MAG: hypothetical protein ABI707_17665 [Ferruginibacter sp.]